jgi:hypothetical protein
MAAGVQLQNLQIGKSLRLKGNGNGNAAKSTAGTQMAMGTAA